MIKEIDDIIIDKLSGRPLSSEEELSFLEWYAKPSHQKHYYDLQRIHSAIKAEKTAQKVGIIQAWEKMNRKVHPRFATRNIYKYAAIILLLFCVGISVFLLPEQKAIEDPSQIIIIPGKKQAVLTLSNGKRIPLSDSMPVITDKGVTISNHNNQNLLIYNKSGEAGDQVYNTINVPRGGEYVLTLADGSTVWLNSESSLTYPVSFGGNTRELKLEGEAYFDVRKDVARPFIIHTSQFDVKVTGTQFNVRLYPDGYESTTLVEGSVQIERNNEIQYLKPGQQSILINGKFEVHEVDPEEAVAWRYETFCFKDRRLENIMNELARWYNVDIFYQNQAAKDYHFTAWFQRSSTIEEVIEILEKTQKIKMELKGKTLTVKTNQ